MDPLLIVHRRLLQPRGHFRYEAPPERPATTPYRVRGLTGGVTAVVAALMFAPFFGG